MYANCDECCVKKRVCWPRLEFFSEQFLIRRSIEPPVVAYDIWPFVCCEPDNDDVIQLSYCFLATAESWSIHDHHCHKAKKRFTAPGVM